MRIFIEIIGFLIALLGVVLFPLPLPFGLILFAIGFGIMLACDRGLQRWLRRRRERNPRFDAFMRRAEEVLPGPLAAPFRATDPDQEEDASGDREGSDTAAAS